MDKHLQSVSPDLPTCSQSSDVVTTQNQASIELCGDKVGLDCLVCSQAESFSGDWFELGHFSQSKLTMINNQLCMVLSIHSGTSVKRIIHQLEEWLTQVRSKLKLLTLTKTELHISEALLNKKSNQEIQDELFISKSTLKTHLNHIYQKAPLLRDIRTYLQSY